MAIGQPSSSSSSSSSIVYPAALGLSSLSQSDPCPPNPLYVPSTTLRTPRTSPLLESTCRSSGSAGDGSASASVSASGVIRTLFSVRARCLSEEQQQEEDEMYGSGGGSLGGRKPGPYASMEEFMGDLMGVFLDVLCTSGESLMAVSSLCALSKQQRLYEQQRQLQLQQQQEKARTSGGDNGNNELEGGEEEDTMDIDQDEKDPSGQPTTSSSSLDALALVNDSQHPPIHIPDMQTHMRQVNNQQRTMNPR